MGRSGKRKSLVPDSLAVGVSAVLAVTILQRGIGFARNLLLCRYLEDTELGRWSLAFSFLMLLAPLIVLGLPGAFGRYVEVFRRRGQLRQFVRQTGVVCAVAMVVATVLLLLFRRQVSFFLFHDPSYTGMVVTLALVLGIVTAGNFLIELLMALRLGRLLSLLQFASSLVFAVVSLAGVVWLSGGAEAVVIGYGVGNAIILAGGLFALWHYGREFFAEGRLEEGQPFWRLLIPFAWWMWVTNLTANLYDAVDRLMIVHLAPLGTDAEALVGQYHAGRVVPMMMVAVAGMLCGVVLPYLTADWEEGRKENLAARMNETLQWSALGFTAVGVVILAMSHWLFDWLLQGKYDQGLAILPWTLAYAIWFGLMLVVQNYLWCAERAGRIAAALLIGLVVNVAANAWCIPRWGVQGAVLATSLAVVVCLTASFWMSARSGMKWDTSSSWIWLVPAALLAGPVVGGGLVAVAAWCLYRRGLFDKIESISGPRRRLA